MWCARVVVGGAAGRGGVVAFVVADVLVQKQSKVPLAEDQHSVGSSARTVPRIARRSSLLAGIGVGSDDVDA